MRRAFQPAGVPLLLFSLTQSDTTGLFVSELQILPPNTFLNTNVFKAESLLSLTRETKYYAFTCY